MSAAEVIDEWRRMCGDDLAAGVGRCTAKAAVWLHHEVGRLVDGDDAWRAEVRRRTRKFWRKFRAADEKRRRTRDE